MTSRDESGSSRLPGAGTVELHPPHPAVRSDESARADARVTAAWERLLAALKGRPVPALIVTIGLGRGELLVALDRHAPATCVLALEPNAARARVFLTRTDCRAWRDSGRLTYLTGPDFVGATEASRVFPDDVDDHVVLVDPTVAATAGPEAVEAARTLKTIVFGARANAEARRHLAPRYLNNVLRNAPAIAAGRDVRALTGAWHGAPAIIAAAGPSLDRAIAPLRDLHGRALLVSVDTALRPLLASGIAPHLAVGLDPSPLNARHFHSLPTCPDTWLVSEAALDSSAHRHFGDRTFWFRVADHEPWPWYNELGIDVAILDVWGSVITAAFQVAMLAGCDPIVFAGADLAYSDGRPYCRGTTYEFDWAPFTAHGLGLEDIWRAWTGLREPVSVADLNGSPTTTTGALLAFRDWLVAHAASSGRRVVNATGAGLFFGDGIEQSSLSDVLGNAPRVRSVGAAASGPTRASAGLALDARFRALGAELGGNAPSPMASRWAAFVGAAWDASVTAATLVETADALSNAQTQALVLPAPPATPVLTRLGECMARWRSTLLESAELPSQASLFGIDPVATLIDASRLLERIAAALRQQPGDLARSAPPQSGAPVSASYSWDDALGRDVALFEGMLGAVIARAPSPQTDSYFTRPVNLCEPAAPADPPQTTIDRPHAARATALLALDWLIAAADAGGPASAEAAELLHILCAQRLVLDSDEPPSHDPSLVLSLEHDAHREIVAPLPAGLDGRALARLATGAIRDVPDSSSVCLLTRLEAPGGSASIAVRSSSLDANAPWRPRRLSVKPRVLTDAGVFKSNIVYATTQGAVCVAPFAHGSFLVRPDGSTEAGSDWGRPIVNELPFGGDGGLVAWSNGAENWREPGPGYVVYRASVDAPLVSVDLPFRPTWGAWRDGRLYWTCYWAGVGAWTPGGDACFALGDETLIAIENRDDGLWLMPCDRHPSGYVLRQRARLAWRWDGTRAPASVSLGRLGAATSRSVHRTGWTAAAYLEADAITLESSDGRRLSMTCFQPFKLAWLDDSLLVSTYHGDLLLFEELVIRLRATE